MKQHTPDNVLYTPLETACEKRKDLRGRKEEVLEKLSSSTGWNIERVRDTGKTEVILGTIKRKIIITTYANLQVGWLYDSTKNIDGTFCCIHRDNSIDAYKFKGNTCESLSITKDKVNYKDSSTISEESINNIFKRFMYITTWGYYQPTSKLVKSKLVRFGSKTSDVEHLKKFDKIREFFTGYEHYLPEAFQERLAKQPHPVQPVLVPVDNTPPVPVKTIPVPANNPTVPAKTTPVNNQQSAEPDSNKGVYIGIALLAALVVSGIFIKMKYFPSANSVKV